MRHRGGAGPVTEVHDAPPALDPLAEASAADADARELDALIRRALLRFREGVARRHDPGADSRGALEEVASVVLIRHE